MRAPRLQVVGEEWHPTRGKRLPAEPLSRDEVLRLIDACGKNAVGLRNRALVVLLWRTGLRVGCEALELETPDLDLPRGRITVREGKGGKRRVVAIDEHACEELLRWLRVRSALGFGEGYVFLNLVHNCGAPMSAKLWRTTIQELGRRAGIQRRVHSHALRHAWASEAEREGMSLYDIQHQLGHTFASTTQTYLHSLGGDGERIERLRERSW